MRVPRFPGLLFLFLLIPFLAYSNFDPSVFEATQGLISYQQNSNGYSMILTPEDVSWVETEDNEFYPVLPGAGEYYDAGTPRIPVYHKLIAIPEGKDARVKNINVQWQSLGNHSIAYESGIDNNIGPDLLKSAKCYFGDADVVYINSCGQWRDIRIAELVYRPIRYDVNSNEVELAQRVEVDIEFVNSGSTPEYNPPGISQALLPVYRQFVTGVDEYLTTDELDEYQPSLGTYLIVIPEGWDSYIQDLAEWRTKCGFNVVIEHTEDFGNQRNELRNNIWDFYQQSDPPLEYVLLVGDVDDYAELETFYIPSGNYDPNIATDHKYTYSPTAGGSFEEVLPRYLIGRMSVDSFIELANVVNKTIQYERNPDDGDLTRFSRALVIADASYAISTQFTKLWVKHKLLDAGFLDVDEVIRTYSSNPPVSAISNPINDGLSWVNYRGFGAHNAWAGPYYTNEHVFALTNANDLPVITSMVCGGGAFDELDDDPCFGEAWIRAGNVVTPKGAVAFVGPSEIDTHTRWNNMMDAGWYTALIDRDLKTMAQCLIAAKIDLFNAYPDSWNANGTNTNSVWFYFHTYNILGDPALRLRKSVPETITVTHPENVNINTTVIPVNVVNANSGIPIRNAVVVVSQTGNILGMARTEDDGSAEVILEGSPGNNAVQLTVTRNDLIPFDELIPTSAQELSLALSGISYNEDENDPENNDDNQVNPGELILPSAIFQNTSTGTISNLTITISSPDTGITIENASETFTNISTGNSLTLSDARFRISPFWQHEDPFQLDFEVNADGVEFQHSVIVNEVQAPQLEVNHYDFDGEWDPGASCEVTIYLNNLNGNLGVGSVNGVISSSFSEVTIVNNAALWSSVGAGASNIASTVGFILQTDESVYPGAELPFTMTLTSEEGYMTEYNLTLQVEGADNTAPTGPATAGYYFYEDVDLGYEFDANSYEYQMIHNVGDNLGLNDYGNNADDLETIDLPFDFTYWHNVYDEITICSNGWFSFGETTIPFFRNRPIPSPLTPPATVAVFWDDLITGGGAVYTWFDEENHLFYIEWHNVARATPMTTGLNFEAILFDPVYHGEPGGQGMIFLAYNNIEDNDYSENYATIGLVSPDTFEGIEYLFSQDMPNTATPLADGRKILIAARDENGIEPPRLSVSPSIVNMNAPSGENAVTNFEITNYGSTGQGFDIISESIWYDWETYIPQLTSDNIPGDNSSGGTSNMDRFGTDEYGYTWMDSNELGGPEYGWLDIGETGEEIDFTGTGDGTVSETIELPFSFKFYGEYYDSLWICEAGYVTFNNPGPNGSYSNRTLPRTNAPRPAIYAFWDNIGVNTSGRILTQAWQDSFVISWEEVYHHYYTTENGPYTFQILLTSDGAVHVRYEDINPTLISCTLGIQNGDGTIGLQVYHNNNPENYLSSGMAIRYSPPIEWLTIEPQSGMLFADESRTISLVGNSENLANGVYRGRLLLRSRGTRQLIKIPVGFSVHSGDNGNSPMLFTLPGESITEGEEFSDLALNPYVYDAESHDDEIIWNIYGSPEVDVTIENNVASFEATDSFDGSARLWVRASDGAFNYSEQEIVLSYGNNNNYPRFTSVSPEIDTIGIDTEFTFTAAAIDPDGDDVEINWYRNEEWVSTGSQQEFTFSAYGEEEIKVTASDGTLESFITWPITVSASDLEDDGENLLPETFKLESIYPNPFNNSVSVKFALPEKANVGLEVYNILGRKVAEFHWNEMNSGFHVKTINGQNWSSGVYFFSWQAGGNVNIKKAVLLK